MYSRDDSFFAGCLVFLFLVLIGYAVAFGIGCLGYWLLCLGFGWEFNIFIPLGIGLIGIFIGLLIK